MIVFSGATFKERRIAARVERALLGVLGQKDIFAVDAAMAGEEDIRALNTSARGVDSVTDVLSFPALENISLPAVKSDFPPQCFDGGRVALGSIMVCRRRAEEQAESYGHAYSRELGYLVCHGLLHLLGYDHILPEEEKEMTALAEKAMTAAGLTRDKAR